MAWRQSKSSQKNVVAWLRRKSDGRLFDVLNVTVMQAVANGHRFMRIGPSGEHCSKRRWEAIDVVLQDYESAPKADDAVDSDDRQQFDANLLFLSGAKGAKAR